MFPFEKKLTLGKLHVDYKDVHECIGVLLTSERKRKIDKVASFRNFHNCVVLENIYDRGNASAVMRSAEALGFVNCHMITSGEKFKESQRTTAGADKWVELSKWNSTLDCIKKLKSEGKKIIATHLDATSKPIADIDFSGPTAFVLGNEKDGISQEMIGLADDRVVLPMTGFVQSYNISVAGALGFYHMYQDRLRQLGHCGDLTPEEISILQAVYYIRTLDSAEIILANRLGLRSY